MEIVFNCLPFLLSISGVHLLNIFQEECLSHILCRPGNQRMQKSVWYLPSDWFLSDIDTSCPQVAFVVKTQRLQIRQISKMRAPNSICISNPIVLYFPLQTVCLFILEYLVSEFLLWNEVDHKQRKVGRPNYCQKQIFRWVVKYLHSTISVKIGWLHLVLGIHFWTLNQF